MKKFRTIFSFRKFEIVEDYEPAMDEDWYFIYVRVGLFRYIRIGQFDNDLVNAWMSIINRKSEDYKSHFFVIFKIKSYYEY